MNIIEKLFARRATWLVLVAGLVAAVGIEGYFLERSYTHLSELYGATNGLISGTLPTVQTDGKQVPVWSSVINSINDLESRVAKLEKK